MQPNVIYKPRQFDLAGLHGISNQTLEMHLKLYQGYVKATNDLTERIESLIRADGIERNEAPEYSELKRRLGFEYNGMILHELYFENLIRGGAGALEPRSMFGKAAEASFGSVDRWHTDFVGVSGMRGVGWAVCYQNPANRRLSNHWVSLHDVGNVAGFRPILVMDIWEHAYLLDYAPTERARYVEAFFANVNWPLVAQRLTS
jgi:superoxide dismutase, Fe-Mn family